MKLFLVWALLAGSMVVAMPPNDQESPLEELADNVGSIAGGAVRTLGNVARIQSRVVAPLFNLGARITAPIVRFKSSLASPFVWLGTRLSRPIIAGKTRLAAPVIRLGQQATAGVREATAPIRNTFSEAVEPISEALQPLHTAVDPIRDAVHDGLGDLNLQGIVDEVNFDQEFQGLSAGSGEVFRGVNNIKELGANLAQNAAVSFAEAAGIRSRRSVRYMDDNTVMDENEDQMEDQMDQMDQMDQLVDDQDNMEPQEDNQDENLDDLFNVNGSGAGGAANPADDPAAAENLDISARALCFAHRVGLETSECHRQETYQTRTCANLDCTALGIDNIHRACFRTRRGMHCKQVCSVQEDPIGGECFKCEFVFTREISPARPWCQEMLACNLGNKICMKN